MFQVLFKKLLKQVIVSVCAISNGIDFILLGKKGDTSPLYFMTKLILYVFLDFVIMRIRCFSHYKNYNNNLTIKL